MAEFGFTVTGENAPSDDFTSLPAGWYPVRCVLADLEPTNAGGQRVKVRLDVTGETHSGRVLWHRINIVPPPGATPGQNKNCEIGREELEKIAAASGVRFTSTEQMLNLEFEVRVSQVASEHTNNSDGKDNEVKGYRPKRSGIPAQPQQAAQPFGGQQVAPQQAAQQPTAQPVQQPAQQQAPAQSGAPWQFNQ